MQYRTATWILLAALITPAAKAAPPLPADLAARTDAYLQARTHMGGFSGAVLLAQGGRVLFAKGYGYADVEQRLRFTPTTRFEAASISKMFTAMAALKLRDQAKLKLDDPICRYLSDCPAAWQAITVQQLIHHSSGIPDYEDRLGMGTQAYLALMIRPGATAALYADAKKRPLEFPPGTKYDYSNTGYLVLAQVVQSAAGEPFARYVTDTLLKPAGMRDSGVLGGKPRPSGLAYGYSFGNVGWDKLLGGFSLTDGTLKRMPELALTPPAGDAWLYTDVEDLYRWSRIMDGSALVPADEAREVFTPASEGYGDGWIISGRDVALEYEHSGVLPGYVSDFIKLPASDITLVVLCNLDRARIHSITRSLVAMARGEPYDPPSRGKPVTLEAAAFSRLTGDYRTVDGETLRVALDEGMLSASLPSHYVAGLIPLSDTRFYMPLADGEATFMLGPDGHAHALNLRYDGQDHPAILIIPKPQ